MWAEIWADIDFVYPNACQLPPEFISFPQWYNNIMGLRLRLSIHLSGYRLAEISEYSE
ncbi:MAG: hypothetical protein IJK94_06435 [Bacteroidaceae bacterium]|nr:hypothetical protein [Bacteroidaceae bacterium]